MLNSEIYAMEKELHIFSRRDGRLTMHFSKNIVQVIMLIMFLNDRLGTIKY